MPKIAAGLLMYRRRGDTVEVLLAHPGGPYFRNKDDGAWTVPKGLVEEGEDLLEAAQRELAEETGISPRGPYLPLGSIRHSSGKVVHVWAFEGDFDPADLVSNDFEVEWPPRSGKRRVYPEIDRAAFYAPEVAKQKLLRAQAPLVDRLLEALGWAGT